MRRLLSRHCARAELCDAVLCDAGLCDAGLCDAGLCDAGLCDAGLSRLATRRFESFLLDWFRERGGHAAAGDRPPQRHFVDLCDTDLRGTEYRWLQSRTQSNGVPADITCAETFIAWNLL
ncbi:unnamed protein product [Lampetra planeri]